MKTRYFILSEDSQNIGIVSATTTEELNSKITLACSEHFDSDCKVEQTALPKFDFGEGKGLECVIEEDFETEITIVESWMY